MDRIICLEVAPAGQLKEGDFGFVNVVQLVVCLDVLINGVEGGAVVASPDLVTNESANFTFPTAWW